MMNRKNPYRGHIAILAANILFGLNFAFAKNVGGDYISPEAFALVRIGLAALLFWMLAPFFPQGKLSVNDYVRLFIAGLFGATINVYSFLKGIVYTSPVDSSIIMTLVPLTVLLLSALFLNEGITVAKLGGIILGAVGAIVLIAYSGTVDLSGDHVAGNLICLGCVLSYSLYLIIIKPLTEKMHPLAVMRWVFLFGFIQTAPFFGKSLIQTNWAVMPADTILSVAYVVIAATFFTYLLTSISLNSLRASTVSMYNYIQPVVATMAAILIGQDEFNIIKLLAAGLVFSGVYLVIRTGKGNKKLDVTS
ncbi:MAG: DMT family transporter [Prevotellaceae bacterium]|nr:DMT family transporter [Prevotellaceae bacterium]